MGFVYRGYLLRSKSIQLPESNRWTVQVTVSLRKDSGGEPREETFSSENSFSSKEMADMEGIILARKIIDGEIPGLSIDVLCKLSTFYTQKENGDQLFETWTGSLQEPLRTSKSGFHLFKDQARLFRNELAVEARLAQLQELHIKPLTAFVEALRSQVGSSASIPYFDPWDGGINAECLFLLEAPGGKAVKSGFISRNNDDQTAENFLKFSLEAGLLRERTVSWNIVPWYIGSQAKIRAAKNKDIEVGIPHLIHLLNLLPKLRAVVLLGRKAQEAENNLSRLRPDLKIFKLPHPSPLFVNNKPENKDIIVKGFMDVRQWLDEDV